MISQLNKNQGCKVTGTIEVYKVPGNIRFYFDREALTQLSASGYNLDTSHQFLNLHFGEDSEEIRDLKA